MIKLTPQWQLEFWEVSLVFLFLPGETVENHTWYCFEISISISRLEMFHVEIHLMCFLGCLDFLVSLIEKDEGQKLLKRLSGVGSSFNEKLPSVN